MMEIFSWNFLYGRVRGNPRLFVAIFASVVILALCYARLVTRQYEAVALIAPPTSSLLTTGGTGGLGGGGASLVSSLLGGGSGNVPESFDRYMNMISSTAIAAELLKDDRIKLGLFRNQWDPQTRAWHAPNGIAPAFSRTVKWMLGLPAWEPPNARSLANYLNDNIAFVNVNRSQVYRMTYRNPDKDFARYLLLRVSSQLDTVQKQTFVGGQRAHIRYIEEVLSRIASPELRDAMSQLYVQEQHRLMLASSDQPFSADVIDAPSVNDKPVVPNIPVILGAGIFLGLCLAMLGVLASGRYFPKPD